MISLTERSGRILCDAMDERDELKLLEEARQKASRIVNDLAQKHAELEANPSLIPPDRLEEGRAALENALNAARRMLKNIEDALAIGKGRNN